MKVSEIMTKNPVCCWPSCSAKSAGLLMQESDTGILPVIQDPFTPRLVGVVTDRDLMLYVVTTGRDPSSTWVDGCMTEDPVCSTEHDAVVSALELMRARQVRRLPVVNEKHEVVGILSLADVLVHAAAENSTIVATLRSICSPEQGPAVPLERIITAA
jgi:CBS domain-containing protein